jgi:hypothetical protein
MEPFEVVPYEIEQLTNVLIKKTKADENTVNKKLHTVYFKDYFKALNAKTLLIEHSYIDHDFLEDYSGYYVRCFTRYPRKCTRLHFFDIHFQENDFISLLQGNNSILAEEKLRKAYLGFIVIKPLPRTIFGRTCLKTYDSDHDRRNFPNIRSYEVNLFGIELCVNSLAFQEQDDVVSACATSALWTIFHGSGVFFQHKIPSPVEITKIACEKDPLGTRYFPNSGLTDSQMANAIRSVGLEPYIVNASEERILKSTLYAYLKIVPLAMAIDLVDISNVSNPHDRGDCMGRHAVAVTGFSLGLDKPVPFKETGFCLRASRIDKIYVHDDQVGPFARMVSDNLTVSYDKNGEKNDSLSFSTSWRGKDGRIGSVRGVPIFILLPLYHKIRITFIQVLDIIIHFDGFLEALKKANFFKLIDERIEWDIYLTTNNKLKTEIFNGILPLSSELRREVLLDNKPRFLWRATAFCKEKHKLDILFDATDIEQGLFINGVIGYDKQLFDFLHKSSKEPSLEKILQDRLEWVILSWFSKLTH